MLLITTTWALPVFSPTSLCPFVWPVACLSVLGCGGRQCWKPYTGQGKKHPLLSPCLPIFASQTGFSLLVCMRSSRVSPLIGFLSTCVTELSLRRGSRALQIPLQRVFGWVSSPWRWGPMDMGPLPGVGGKPPVTDRFSSQNIPRSNVTNGHRAVLIDF